MFMFGIAKKQIAISLSALIAVSVFAGCSRTKPSDPPAATQSVAPQSTQATKSSSESVYPLKKGSKLKYWIPVNANWSNYAQNYGDTEIAKELQKRTGVSIEYIHPPQGQDRDVFNIMIASGDLPDIVAYRWTDFPGGPSAAIGNNVIIKLNDAINKWSPNLKNYLEKDRPQYNKEAKMDDGSYYFYPLLRDGQELLFTSGPIFRKDWLDDLGLSVPETTDEWYTALKAFKEKKNATSPLTTIGDKNGLQCIQMFEGCFKTFRGFYINKDGKMVYGYNTPEFKNMLVYFNKLYSEGLLDKNFNATDRKAQDSNMLNGKSGATYGAGGSNIGVWIPTAKEKDPKYDLVAAKFPVQKKGDKPTFLSYTSGIDRNIQAAISTKCKDIEAAARFLDYGFSKEGHILMNFGIENVSYKNVNGVPTYTEIITKNPNKLSFAQALANYTNVASGGAALAQDVGYIKQYYALDQQKKALTSWGDNTKTIMPLITPTDEESAESAKIINEVNTYVMEMQVKFIMGTEPLSNFDKFLDTLKKMNVDKATALQQQALDRYNKR